MSFMSYLCTRFVTVTRRLIDSKSSDRELVHHVSLPNCEAYHIKPVDLTPASAHRWVLLSHGGGFCVRGSRFYISFACQLARALNCQVLLPRYRLSPQAVFPAAVDDSIDGLDWIRRHHPAAVVVAVGDSAGGNLSTNVFFQRGDQLSGLALLSPWLDLSLQGESWVSSTERLITRPAAEVTAWLYLVGRPPGTADAATAARVKALSLQSDVSPVYAKLAPDAFDKVPTLIQVSNTERLYSDSVDFWTRCMRGPAPAQPPQDKGTLGEHLEQKLTLARSGDQQPPHQLSVYSNLPHVWSILFPLRAASLASFDEVVKFSESIFSK